MLPVPGERIAHVWPVAVIGALAAIGGVLLPRPLQWGDAPRGRFPLATALVAVAVFVIQALTGGEASPADEYLWVVVVYAAFFFRARPALPPRAARPPARLQPGRRLAPPLRQRRGRGEPRARAAHGRAALLRRRRDHLRRPR